MRLSGGLRDVFLYLLAKGFPGGASVASTFVLIRFAGADVYSEFAFFSTFVISLCSFGVGWLNQSQLRFSRLGCNEPASLRGRVLRSYVQVIGGGVVVMVAALGSAVVYLERVRDGGYPLDLAVVWFALAFHGLYLVNGGALQASLQAKKVVAVELLRGCLLLILPLGFYFFLSSVGSVLSPAGLLAAGFAAGVGIASLLGIYFLREYLIVLVTRRVRWATLKRILRKYWNFGWPMSVWLGVSTGLPLIERVVLKNSGGGQLFSDYVTHYEIFYRVFALGLFPITMALHPRIMQKYNMSDIAGSNALIGKGLVLQALVGLCVIGVLLSAADLVLAGMGLRAVQDQLLFVASLCCAGVLWQMALLVHKPLERVNKTRLMVLFMFVSAGVLFLGDIYIVSRGSALLFALMNVLSACVYISLCLSHWFFFGRKLV